jgi:hypothetical protein
MHTDLNSTKNSGVSGDIMNNIQAIKTDITAEVKTEITKVMQSIPEYMEKIIKITDTNNTNTVHKNSKDNQHVLNYLRTVLERLLKLENKIEKVSTPQNDAQNPNGKNNLNDIHQKQNDMLDIHSDDEESLDIDDILHDDNRHENHADDASDFLEENEWDDNDNKDFKKSSFSNKIDGYDDDEEDDDNNIRSFDRKAILKSVHKNTNSKSGNNKNGNHSGLKKIMSSGSLTQIMLICGGVIAILALVGIIIL